MHPESEDAPSELIHDDHHPVGFEDQGLAAKEADTPQTVLRVSEKSEPGRAICARFWTVVLGQYAERTTSLSIAMSKAREIC